MVEGDGPRFEPVIDQGSGVGLGQRSELDGALEAPEQAQDADSSIVRVHGGGELADLGQLMEHGRLGGRDLQGLGEQDDAFAADRFEDQGEHLPPRLPQQGAVDVPPGHPPGTVGLGAEAGWDETLGDHQPQPLVDLLGEVLNHAFGRGHGGPETGPFSVKAILDLTEQ